VNRKSAPSSSAPPSGSDQFRSRRRFLGAASGLLVLWAGGSGAQEGVFLRPEESPRVLFPGAEASAVDTVPATPELRSRIRAELGRVPPSLWEPAYPIFTASRDGAVVGYVVIVEEIGKHRPITFAVAVRLDGLAHDAAVLAYREPYGGEIRQPRFLAQYRGKGARDDLQPYRDIRNITGATLSVEATGRAVHKAIAVLKATGRVS
jgi:Na+-transporting NADH:ubiquinone oxidoreductase subunit C